jgi:hypothetical protein
MKATKIYVGHITCDKRTQFTEIEVSAFVDLALSRHGIEGATIYDATGYWRCDTEPSTVIEIIHEGSEKSIAQIMETAEFLKRFLHQESVMVVTHDVQVTFIQ